MAHAKSHANHPAQCGGRVELIRPQQKEKLTPCQANCPSGTDIRGWIAFIAQQKKLGLNEHEAFAQAWLHLVDTNPLPAVLGRVCPHPCETECNRGAKEAPVAIHHLERHIGDWGLQNKMALPRLSEEQQPESIGVIGAGPAGLSFAYQMARRGYAITLYEANEEPGGMLRYGIPAYRLPREVLAGEIARILDLGVELQLHTRVGRDITQDQLKARHAALFVGIGAHSAIHLQIPGETGAGLYAGVEFMDAINRGKKPALGARVAVIGGGNTAVDAARAARRLGAQVSMLYRRTRAEMPAATEEIDDAIAEGIELQLLTSPVAIRREGERIVGIEIQRMRLGQTDSSGRRTPLPIPDSNTLLPFDTVIAAVSQQPDWRGLEALTPEGECFLSPSGRWSDQVWAGGDVGGVDTVTSAIGQGRIAAESLHAQLRGTVAPQESRPLITAEAMRLGFYRDHPRAQPRAIAVAARLATPAVEIMQPLSKQEFMGEISRCLSCGSCLGCEQCWMFCNAGSYARRENPAPGSYFIYNANTCEGCTKCLEVCPCGYLEPAE